ELHPVGDRDLHPLRLQVGNRQLLRDGRDDPVADVNGVSRRLAVITGERERARRVPVPDRDGIRGLDLLGRAPEVRGERVRRQDRRRKQQGQPTDHERLLSTRSRELAISIVRRSPAGLMSWRAGEGRWEGRYEDTWTPARCDALFAPLAP